MTDKFTWHQNDIEWSKPMDDDDDAARARMALINAACGASSKALIEVLLKHGINQPLVRVIGDKLEEVLEAFFVGSALKG
jgi:hypothetical protein